MSQTMREALMSLARREDTNLTWADRVLIGKVIAALSAPSNEQAQQGEGFGAEVAKQAVNVAWPELASRPAAAAPAGGVTPGAYLRKKAEDYAMQYGSDDMGGLSFGSGAHAEVKMDHYNNLLELADELDALTTAARAAELDQGAESRQSRYRAALEEIAAMEYDRWSNGARAKEIAQRILDAGVTPTAAEVVDYCARHGVSPAKAKEALTTAARAAAPAAQAYMCQETETPCTRCTTICEAALAGAAQVDELRENFEALDLRNHVLERGMQALMARLASLLDEDQFKDCEDIVRRAGIEAPAIGVTLEDVRQACADADIPEDIESRLLAALAGAAHESGCKGGECKHASDCAVHCSDDPRPCDCGAAQGAEPAPDPMNYKEMFLAAVAALAEIDALLGLPEDGCNDPQVTVSALKDYIAGAKETAAYRDQWVDAQYAEAAQGAEPAGWRLVPIVATPEMVANAMRECGGIGAGSYGEHSGADGDDMRSVWDSMLAAAPQSPTGTEKKA